MDELTPKQQHHVLVDHLEVDHGYDKLARLSQQKLSRLRYLHDEDHPEGIKELSTPESSRQHTHPTGHVSPIETASCD